MRVALAQINTTVGDFPGNLERIRSAARGLDVSLAIFPELCICGYTPRDLLEEPGFLDACRRAVESLAADRDLPPLVVGAPWGADGPGKPLFNAALLVRGGEITPVAKRLLPSYDVFDERRWFRDGPASRPVAVDGVPVGFTVCEDMWTGAEYAGDPIADLVAAGAELIVNLSASPYRRDKPALRRSVVEAHVARHRVPMALCNLVGGNDQLVFDGSSVAYDADGRLCAHAALFAEEVVVTDFDGTVAPPPERLRDAIVLGIRDYFEKTGFSDALVGMSGGVDSSLVASLAVEALGAGHVAGVAMPGPFSADYSLDDARELAGALGIGFRTIPIVAAYDLLRAGLEAAGSDPAFGVAEQNIQARLRGLLLMTLANKERRLVLVPSNKSELAMGYCTLYGDMVGALAPIADLYKTEVYAEARACGLPARVLSRAPSAELAPDQTDEETLPPYETLDAILRLHLEERRPAAAIPGDPAVVARVLRAVARAEYKRQQGAPVLKLSAKAFGLGRRYPIVERFEGGAP